MTEYKYDGFEVIENKEYKILMSKNANYVFNRNYGEMITWGKTFSEDAEVFPSPTILDLEVTTICSGVGGVLCPFCYKGNNPNGKNMSFETFKTIFDKLPKSITQIAFGADSKCKSNPDIFKMMQYARNNGIVPNITVAEINIGTAKTLADLCGAVAVSRYHDPDLFANSVKLLTDNSMEQVNCHLMISEETFDRAVETINQVVNDFRLRKLNAIVFLSLKTKGKGEKFHTLSQDKFYELIYLCKKYNIKYGFDSCSALKFFKTLDDEGYDNIKDSVQPCESTLESSYINVDGDFFPCSFTEGTDGWENGISVINCNDFIKDVWNNKKVEEFRNKLIATKKTNKFGCRNCPIYKI